MLNGQAITNPDGTITSFKGARMSFDDGTVMLFPTFWDGKVIADPHVAMQKAIASGIRWPIYKDDATAAAAESKIHRIMESDSDVAQGRVK